MLDLSNEIMVGEEFWDFLGGKGAYEELQQIFEDVGIQMRSEIDAKFARLAPNQQKQSRAQ